MRYFFILGFIFFGGFLFSQKLIKTGNTALSKFYRWGDGYVVDMPGNTSFSENHTLTLYSPAGDQVWEREFKVEGVSYQFVVSGNSSCAYVVATTNTYPKGLLQKLDESADILTVYQFSKTGEIKEVRINYMKNFGELLGNSLEFISLEYLASYSAGMSGILARCDAETNWKKKYVLFSLTERGEIMTKLLDFELTQKEWQSRLKSNLNYHQMNDKLIISQVNLGSESMNIELGSFDLTTIDQISKSKNTVVLNPNLRYGLSYENNLEQEGVANLGKHVYGEYSAPTLGILFNYQSYNDKLYFVGNYFLPKGNMVALSELEGYFYFEVDFNADKNIPADEVGYVDFDKTIGEISSYTVIVENGVPFHVCKAKKGAYYFVDGENRGEIEIATGFSSDFMLMYSLAKTHGVNFDVEQAKYSSNIYRDGDNYNIYSYVGTSSIQPFHVQIKK